MGCRWKRRERKKEGRKEERRKGGKGYRERGKGKGEREPMRFTRGERNYSLSYSPFHE